jgi:hypothetical protein
MYEVRKITVEDAIALLTEEEDHFSDFIDKSYSGEAAQKNVQRSPTQMVEICL